MSESVEEVVKNIFNFGDYPIATIEFGEWEKAEEDVSWWSVSLHLKSCDETIPVGTCWLDDKDKEVSFYVEMDYLMEMITKEVGNKTQELILQMFGDTISPKLNVQVYGKDYT